MVVDHAYELNYELINAGLDRTPHQYNYYCPDWHPYYQGSDLHTLQSVTKGVVSIVIGIAMQRGELPDLGAAALDFFEDYEIKNLDGRKRRMTLEDLLTMRSGLEWDEWTYAVGDQRNSATQLETSDDWIQFVLDRPMARESGEAFVYSSGAAQLLSVVVKKATGLHIDEYAEEHLFRPLGITEYYWKKTPKGWPDTEGGLYLKAEDLAKIGYLLLREGVWEGEQIVSKEWVDEMTSPKVEDVFPDDPDENLGYAYLWWTMDRTSTGGPQVYAALGYGGQYLFVVPELDLLAVFNGWNIYEPRPSIIDLFLEDILPATESS
jgi:CubicO group peptidase (beta-lactamase class C family)